MATPQTAPLQTFSALEQFLIERTEEAIRDGCILAGWCRGPEPEPALFPLDLHKQFRLPNKAEGAFGTLEMNGQKRSIMLCRQTVEFGRVDRADAAGRLKEFVLARFLPRAHWTYADGHPGGFTIEQSLYRTAGGGYGRFGAEDSSGCIDCRELGTRYDWVLLTVRIHDFVMDFGPFRKRFKEAACVAPNAAMVRVAENPSEDCQLEVSVGYPFVEYAPIPNHFGFGPGKFGSAVKLYSFRLMRGNHLRVRMDFAAAPRCRKVLDLGKRVPDPVYGGAALLSRLSLGRWSPQGFHDFLDSFMLAQHGRVHQALMDGVEKVWSDWLTGEVT